MSFLLEGDRTMRKLSVVLLKASKYGPDGYVERFGRGFMPNATVPYINSLIPDSLGETAIHTATIDEYVQINLDYLNMLDARANGPTTALFVGVQSHQLHRALDLAVYARDRGCMTVIGGPHAMTCDTSLLQGRGISFATSEAEMILTTILADAVQGELQPVYGNDQRWMRELDPPVLKVPNAAEFEKHLTPLLGVYPARGCPYTCDFCSVIQIAGRNIRSQPVKTTIATLKAAQAAGVKWVMFTSDNFNKYSEAKALCEAIIEERLPLRYFIQCDTQIVKQPELIKLFARAGVFEIFLGVESLDRATLVKAHKAQNHPDTYRQIKEMCDEVGIDTHFSMIIGFPGDTHNGILRQLDELKRINPYDASFYLLCPIPGTEQYKDFLAKGLITEENLDRFDGTCPTWAHPNLSWPEWQELFRKCFRGFYSFKHAATFQPKGGITRSEMWKRTAFAWWCTYNGQHPMSGGLGRKRIDHVSDYINLRRRTFGFDLAPLPNCLQLSESDAAFNRTAKLTTAAD